MTSLVTIAREDGMTTDDQRLSLADRPDFARLYEETHLDVYRYVYALHGGPVQDVEDLTAATYERAWNARGRFSGTRGEALGWLLTIARNLVFDAHRRHLRRGSPADIEQVIVAASTPGPEDRAQTNEMARILWGLLGQLPERSREIVVLRYILGWPVKDIAEHLKMRYNTVSVTIYRTLNDLREAWPDDEELLLENGDNREVE